EMPKTTALGLIAAASLVAAGLCWQWPVVLGERLPSLLMAAAVAVAVMAAAVRLCRMGTLAAAVLGASCLLRMAFVLHPAFPSIAAPSHAHNVHRFGGGQLISSAISDAEGRALPTPSPPALYALLAPFVAPGDYARGELVVRLAMGLLETTTPLLVWALMR